MEHKRSAEASSSPTPQPSRPPIQVSEPSEQEDLHPPSSSLPHIILPLQDEIRPSPTPPGNPLLANPDFIGLREFVAEYEEAAASEFGGAQLKEPRLIS